MRLTLGFVLTSPNDQVDSMEAAMAFRNPFRPGAGHTPPFLAGRKEERREFLKLLDQEVILANLLLTGLRGVGKTVLLDTFKPLAVQRGWLWVGADLSESTTVDEERLATRILTDVALATSSFVYDRRAVRRPGFGRQVDLFDATLDYPTLRAVYEQTGGLVADRLKAALAFVWRALRAAPNPPRGIVFAYDEAQNMADHAGKDEYPLSVMLDVFQSIQRQGVRFLLALTGLPTLFPKLVEARTYSERMFRVLFLNRLDPPDVREAIVRPIQEDDCPISFTEESIRQIERHSGGYPYFIQFICHEAFDVFVSQITTGSSRPRRPDQRNHGEAGQRLLCGPVVEGDRQAARSPVRRVEAGRPRIRVQRSGDRGALQGTAREGIQPQPREPDPRGAHQLGDRLQEPAWEVLLRGSASRRLHPTAVPAGTHFMNRPRSLQSRPDGGCRTRVAPAPTAAPAAARPASRCRGRTGARRGNRARGRRPADPRDRAARP